jgi:hypothetical protein
MGGTAKVQSHPCKPVISMGGMAQVRKNARDLRRDKNVNF